MPIGLKLAVATGGGSSLTRACKAGIIHHVVEPEREPQVERAQRPWPIVLSAVSPQGSPCLMQREAGATPAFRQERGESIDS